MAWDVVGQHGMLWDSMGQHGMAWDGMGWCGTAWDDMGHYGMAWDGVGHCGPWSRHYTGLKGAVLSRALQEPSLQDGIHATELSKP